MGEVARGVLWDDYQGDAVDLAILEMETNGFLIDTEFCNAQARIAEADEEASLGKLREWLASLGTPPLGGCDLIWSSPQKMVQLFHEHLKYPPSPVWKLGRVKVEKGDRKLDEKALEWIRARITKKDRWGIDELIRLRRIRGCLKYLRKLPTFIAPDGLVHPVCGPAGDADDRVGTITGRLAGKNPEFMQIPSNPEKDWYHVRRAFIAPPDHHLLVADYQALEMVILAHVLVELFGDHQLAEMLAPGAPDIHGVNARRVFDYLGWKVDGRPVREYSVEDFKTHKGCKRLRQMIKEIIYGLLYGKGAFGFATSLRDENDEPIGEEMAQRLVDALLDSMPAVRKFHAWCWEFILRYKGMTSVGGRWLNLKELVEGDDWSKKKALRMSQNYPMQAGGSYIVGRAMVSLSADQELKAEGYKLERMVHDEIDARMLDAWVVERPGQKIDWEVARIAKHMTSCVSLHVPLQVSVGHGSSWHDAK